MKSSITLSNENYWLMLHPKYCVFISRSYREKFNYYYYNIRRELLELPYHYKDMIVHLVKGTDRSTFFRFNDLRNYHTFTYTNFYGWYLHYKK